MALVSTISSFTTISIHCFSLTITSRMPSLSNSTSPQQARMKFHPYCVGLNWKVSTTLPASASYSTVNIPTIICP